MISYKSPAIRIVQGDTYNCEIEIQGLDIFLIENIYFSCEQLNICKKVEFDEELQVYNLTFNSQETENFKNGVFNYDLTFKFFNDSIRTVQYKSTITILKKTNKVVCYEG